MRDDPCAIMETAQRLKAKINRLMEPLAQAEGLTILQCLVLTLLDQGELSVGALSAQTHMGQANTSTLCKKLAHGGYITRTRDPRDARTVLLALTDQGREALGRIHAGLRRYMQAMDSLSPELLGELLRGVRAADILMDHLIEQSEGARNHAEISQHP